MRWKETRRQLANKEYRWDWVAQRVKTNDADDENIIGRGACIVAFCVCKKLSHWRNPAEGERRLIASKTANTRYFDVWNECKRDK